VSAFNIPPSRFPDRAQRSRLFFDALQSLVTWWAQTFFDIPDHTLGLRTRPWDEVQEIVEKLPRLTKADFFAGGSAFGDGKGKGKEKEKEDLLERLSVRAGGERLRTVNSLMKKALQQEGSRDASAILFVSLARAVGLGVRLVTSLQAVPWRAEKVVVKKTPGAGRGGRTLASRQGEGPSSGGEESEDELEEVPIPVPGSVEGGPGAVRDKIRKGKKNIRAGGRRRLPDPADMYRLRKPKPAPQTLGAQTKPKTNQGECSFSEALIRDD
jgi:xeroderma pigmentosum group C-complementing protein